MPSVLSGDGTSIWWQEEGHGEPVLLIQGLGSSLEMWLDLPHALARTHRVVTFDNRGVGRSDIPGGEYDLAQMARDAIAVLDAAGIERAHIFGVSLGSMIAQHLLIEHPSRARSAVLGCTVCGGPDHVARDRVVRDILMNRERRTQEEAVRAMLPYTLAPATPDEVIERYVRVRMANPITAAGYFGQLMASAKLATWSRLHTVQTPTLVIGAAHDGLIPPGNAADVARRIPDARYELLPDASHNFWVDQPARTLELVRGWFTSV